MSIQLCACGETLATPCELRNGICIVCIFSPPGSEPTPVTDDERTRIAAKWFVIGKEYEFNRRARATGNDGAVPYADLVRQEYNADIERDTIRVRCESCGSHWLFDDPPGRLTECEACRV